MCIIIIYVDDMLVRNPFRTYKNVEKIFSMKIEKNVADYLGCEFHMNQDKTIGWLGEPSIIRSLEKSLELKQ